MADKNHTTKQMHRIRDLSNELKTYPHLKLNSDNAAGKLIIDHLDKGAFERGYPKKIAFSDLDAIEEALTYEIKLAKIRVRETKECPRVEVEPPEWDQTLRPPHERKY